MKRQVLSLFTILIFCARLSAQTNIIKNNIVGIWQYNTPRVGNGYAECFAFFRNGTFRYQYDPSDDTRIIVSLKGEYRIEKDDLFLTILYKVERVGGKIMTGAFGTDEYLFVFNNDKTKQIVEPTPKELDPLFFSKFEEKGSTMECYINNRHYYKVSSNPNKIKDQ